MTKEILFHLGDYKTGSTSIQRSLADQAFVIPGQRVVFTARENHMDLTRSLRPDHPLFDRQDRLWTDHAEAIAAADADVAVISAENMNHLEPEQLAEAVARYFPGYDGRIRYVTYLRPHAERIVSSFAERRKLGEFHKGLKRLHDVIREKGRLFYAPRFAAWRACFGTAFELRAMTRDQLYNNDVVHDFFHLLCRSDRFEITGNTRRNPSLSVPELLVLSNVQRHIQRVSDDPQITRTHRHRIARHVADALSQLTPGLPGDGHPAKPHLHKALARDIRDTYQADAAKMDRRYFKGTPFTDALDRAVDTALPAPLSLALRDYYDDRSIRLFQALAVTLAAEISGAETPDLTGTAKWAPQARTTAPDAKGPPPTPPGRVS